MQATRSVGALLALGMLLAGACDATEPTRPDFAGAGTASFSGLDEPAPAPLVTLASASSSLELWPYTAAALGAPAQDPVNLAFPGVDVRSIRAALMMLDGNRTSFGFPAAPPFDCTWKEAMGANQAAYATPSGWTGSAIQLECGDYGPIRFHMRLFPVGPWSIANAHFEVQVQGTNAHEVLSWELAEQFVTVDFVRSGMLASAPTPTAVVTPAPTFRAINPLVYNGLPAALKGLIGGPPSASAPVPIANDGRGVLLQLQGVVRGERAVARREFVLHFDQTIPKPFCIQGPLDYLKVRGSIDFRQQVVVSGSGNFMSRFHARGELEIIPINPLTGVMGAPLRARVSEHDRSVVTDNVTLVSTLQIQLILPPTSPASGSLRATLNIGPGASDHGTLAVSCAS